MKKILALCLLSFSLFAEECCLQPIDFNEFGNFEVEDPLCLFLTADFLYWQAKEDNLDYGITTASGFDFPIFEGEVLAMDFDFHPGVKVGFGVDFYWHDHWDLFGEWTYLNSHNNSEASFADFTIAPSLIPPSVVQNSVASSAKANWKILYNTFDINLGRPFYSGEMLRLRPHGGVRGNYFRQKYSANYRISEPLNEIITMTTTFNSWGVGPRVGIETDWLLGYGCKIFGNVGFSLLFTLFNTREKGQDAVLSLGSVSITPNSYIDKRHHNMARANLESILGIGWEWYFDNCNWHADFTAGYEFQYWPDANGDIRFFDTTAKGIHGTGGNLVLHGLTFMGRLDF